MSNKILSEILSEQVALIYKQKEAILLEKIKKIVGNDGFDISADQQRIFPKLAARNTTVNDVEKTTYWFRIGETAYRLVTFEVKLTSGQDGVSYFQLKHY